MPPPNALICQAALTRDATELVEADFGAQSIYLIDPDTASGSAVKVGSVPGDANSGPVRVAATSAQTVSVGLAGYSGGGSGCSTCLQEMNLSTSPVSVQTASQLQVSALTSAPMVENPYAPLNAGKHAIAIANPTAPLLSMPALPLTDPSF